ncbi:PLP-dependent transferase [Guyanagaster necrorhizus]|uniref:PLP-dependent transferase n=1 Tax=Guyanagaster necrorhizus TaxID=856835 RepID=A0A9P8ASS1_9AGAR|nr:PLP-dependent transferase [Guyanagaster necrorhizus MCA 3950]KAG7446629.1 PLP-dependent transferase [Guyanagaster necrorhizus MCA 3950]
MEAIDLRHHLNTLSVSRAPSPLKDIMSYMAIDGMVSLAGGLPHPSLFPFVDLEANVYSSNVDLHSITSRELIHLTIRKDDRNDGQVLDLSTSLQYSSCTGLPWLLNYTRELTRTVFRPAYKNFEVLLNEGSTAAWNKVVNLLCEMGDFIFVEKQTYPSAQALWIPMGCHGVPIEMDAEGMRSDALENALCTWDSDHPGVKRSHVLYTVPTGHNPTGCTMSARRKQEIYALCVKYDIIIVEDDPYYFLQFDEYNIKAEKQNSHAFAPSYDESTFLSSLEHTFLSFDTEGRVIRLDTFSKTLAPGNRVGWFTCNPVFSERLLRATEVVSQAPSGWSQAILSELLRSWGISGYLKWLSGLKREYAVRRNWICDIIGETFDVKTGTSDEGLVVYGKGTKVRLFSFVPPRAGMFLWCKLYLEENKEFLALKAQAGDVDPEAAFEKKLWRELAHEKVLLTPGSYYTPWQGKEKSSIASSGREHGVIFFRMAFSMTTANDMTLGIQRMARVLCRSWGLA